MPRTTERRIVRITVDLTKREAAAVSRAELSVGYGVQRSQALLAAEAKILAAVRAAMGLPPQAGP